jgi:hypothetical protein
MWIHYNFVVEKAVQAAGLEFKYDMNFFCKKIGQPVSLLQIT